MLHDNVPYLRSLLLHTTFSQHWTELKNYELAFVEMIKRIKQDISVEMLAHGSQDKPQMSSGFSRKNYQLYVPSKQSQLLYDA